MKAPNDPVPRVGLRYQWCTSLSYDKEPKVLEALVAKEEGLSDSARCSYTTKGLSYRWCTRLPHDQGPKIPDVLRPKGEGLGLGQYLNSSFGIGEGLIASFFIFLDASPNVPKALVPIREGSG
ncbi:hypothetical protein GOBAR_AA09099 [Gossypium barbadense]|uniref:Uncharacterized protein n=1 Tax=Gossypium barbadense TaxID=3634 RepID=A0A2P5Y7I3_GOSBA|nr:hypothetical protein GOBAR_AA09099 [Gossypium barbadense]